MAVLTVRNVPDEVHRAAIAKRIRGGSFKGTVMGDITFEPNGQLGSKHYLFTVQDKKIVVTP